MILSESVTDKPQFPTIRGMSKHKTVIILQK